VEKEKERQKKIINKNKMDRKNTKIEIKVYK
jgi:hypothetical protein